MSTEEKRIIRSLRSNTLIGDTKLCDVCRKLPAQCKCQSETGTPRTDAFADHPCPTNLGELDWRECCTQWIDFARTLERELQESRRENERLNTELILARAGLAARRRIQKGLQSDLAEARVQLAESEATSKEAVMRMREQADTFTAQLAQVTEHRNLLREEAELERQRAIEHGFTGPDDGTPVVFLATRLAQVTAENTDLVLDWTGKQTALIAQRDDLKARLESASKDSERLDWLLHKSDHSLISVVSEIDGDWVINREEIDAAIIAQEK